MIVINKDVIGFKWEEICKCMKEFDEVYHKMANYFNLSDSSFWILYDLYSNNLERTQKEICTDWYVSKQTINSSIKYLLNKGYIYFKYDSDNKKNKIIYLSKLGREFANDTIGKIIDIENRSFKNIDIKDMDKVIDFFKTQTKSLKEESNKFIKEKIENE